MEKATYPYGVGYPTLGARVKGQCALNLSHFRQAEIADLSRFIQETESLEAAAYAANLLREMNAPTACNPNPVLTFGKHRGQAIRNVPQAYLRWLVALPDLSRDLRGPVTALLAQYDARRSQKAKGGRRK